MLKIKITAGANAFEVETDAAINEIAKYLDLWFGVIAADPMTQDRIDQLAARGAAANDALKDVVSKTTPT